ncbi:hypothetical protein NPIL_628251 [Nephila pilipes]|uniref:Uncharacterized protein n=1 Tax=Nephila pilipes TaxID=299642 RepID=A0A8X6PLV8_NEPPI|nr:hypothetical protein NPIL_628251 [Nephila pilipes]
MGNGSSTTQMIPFQRADKSSKWSRTDKGNSSHIHTSPDPRSKETKPHDPRFQEVRSHDPTSQDARPRDFKMPPRHIPTFKRRFLPSSWEEPRPQIFFHHHGMAAFSRRDDGYRLTNGVASYALDKFCAKTLSKCLTYINIDTVRVTDPRCNFGLFKTVYQP